MLNRFKAIYRVIILGLGLVFLLGITPVWAAKSLPEPNDQGNYISKSDHLYWQVVDSDPSGLNCRMGNAPIEEIWNPDNPGFPAISSWPAVTTLKPDEVFRAQPSYGGFVITFDDQFLPWIFVKKKSDGTPANCFVRANIALIKPVEEPIDNNVSTQPIEEPTDNNISTQPVENPTDNNVSTPPVETPPEPSFDDTEPFIDL